MSPNLVDAEDRLYLLDGSRSMNERLGKEKLSKINAVRQILMDFCMENWSASYYTYPLRIGITGYRLLGTPGTTQFEEIIPLDPEPVSLELWRLKEFSARGGAVIKDALDQGLSIIKESPRGKRRIVLIGDGGDNGEDPAEVAREIGGLGVELVSVELGKDSTHVMRLIAKESGGKYHLAKTYDEAMRAIL
jgi:Mg-chelatase subunit ChlD